LKIKLDNKDLFFNKSIINNMSVNNIDLNEDENVVEYLKKNNNAPEYINIRTDENEGFGNKNIDDFNDNGDELNLYKQAVKIVVSENKTSISYLGQKLRIGYNKAANFIEKMEEEGILSSPDRSGKRMIIKENND
jgi:S-DNA-T family DNA segregation ATPase FtsK/SpoIIIE